MQSRKIRFVCAALAAGSLVPAAARAVDITINEDAYVDSTYSIKDGLVVANTQNINFDTFTGTSGSSMTPSNKRVKVVSSNGSTQFPGDSKVHGLFKLPQTFWDAFATGNVADAIVTYHIFTNSLNAGFSDARDVELHPMTQPWGTTTATWRTYDGVHPWSTTDTTSDHDDPGFGGGGGDYDAARFVDTINPNVVSGTLVQWDITSLLADPVALNELRTNGALLKETDELNFEGNRFYSMYSFNAGPDTVPFVSVTFVPEPAAVSMLVVAPILLSRRSRKVTTTV